MSDKTERPWAAICVCLMFALIVVIWAAYGITDASSQDSFKCPDPFTCVENPNQDLPGGGHDPKFSMSPWSIGQRDCFWFSCDPERCALPALFSEAKDLCIDMAYWKDRYDDDCIWWNRYITGTDAMWSPRKDGTDPKCNTKPPTKPLMSANELLAMKSACCICGGGHAGRDYAGPTIAPDKSFQPPPAVTLPQQHEGKTPTHLTQCCACWPEAVKRGILGKSEAQVKDINENRKTYDNPRGGTLTCKKNMEKDFDKRRDLLTPFIIGASVITAVILCCMLGIWWMGSVDLSKPGSTSVDRDAEMPFLVKL